MKINRYLIFLIFLVIGWGCSRKPSADDPVVARVGDRTITASEFIKNYEFGFSHLKPGANPKRAYLDLMIKEQLLARAGYQLSLDTAGAVQRALRQLEEELLIEELFLDQVHRKIEISEEEIKAAIVKSKVNWKFRFWFEPTRAGAELVAQAMRTRGYTAVVDDFLRQHPETPLTPHQFESDYVTWLEVPEPLVNAIKDLPRGEISAPIELNGVFYIVQITDIRQTGLLESEYASKAASIKKILFYRKVLEAGVRYVSAFLTPKQIVTRGEPFHLLAEALADWKKGVPVGSFYDAIQHAAPAQPALFAVQQKLSETLVQYQGGRWSLADFIKEKLDPAELTADPNDLNAFQNQLNHQIAIRIRNHFLLAEARRKGLRQAANVQNQLQAWQDKWVYQETRTAFTHDLKVTDAQMLDFFENHRFKYKISQAEPTFQEFKVQIRQDTYLNEARKLLNARIDSLRHDFPVEIYESVLDTITVSASPKSRQMSVLLYKKSNNRQAFPIVDPAWGF